MIVTPGRVVVKNNEVVAVAVFVMVVATPGRVVVVTTPGRVLNGIKAECELGLTSMTSIFLSRSCIFFVDPQRVGDRGTGFLLQLTELAFLLPKAGFWGFLSKH